MEFTRAQRGDPELGGITMTWHCMRGYFDVRFPQSFFIKTEHNVSLDIEGGV